MDPVTIGGGILTAASLAKSLFGGNGDKDKAEALLEQALAQERERQQQLEGRFESMRPLRRQSLTSMLAAGSTENPFSRALSPEQQQGIMGQIDASQQARGLHSTDADRLSALTREYSDMYETKPRDGFGGMFDRLGSVVKIKKSLMENFGLSDGQAEAYAKRFMESGDVSEISNLNMTPQSGGGALF
jgi:hypothetical protein